MKRFRAFFLLVPLAVLSACTSVSGGSHEASYEVETDTLICRISVPQPEASLRLSVGEWVDELLGGFYPGDASDIHAMVDFYGRAHTDTLQALLDECPGKPVGFEAIVEKAYETDDFVTYCCDNMINLGGAHPSTTEFGATFRKSDGRRITWDIVRTEKRYEFNDLMLILLEGYFGVKNSNQLEKVLSTDRTFDLPLPKNPPFFLENGVVFVYQEYEIAAYAYGLPSDTIPYERMQPLLTGWAQKMLPK